MQDTLWVSIGGEGGANQADFELMCVQADIAEPVARTEMIALAHSFMVAMRSVLAPSQPFQIWQQQPVPPCSVA